MRSEIDIKIEYVYPPKAGGGGAPVAPVPRSATEICEVCYRQISQKRSISVSEMYSTICLQWIFDHFVHGLTYIDPLLTKVCANNDYYVFVPCFDLDF